MVPPYMLINIIFSVIKKQIFFIIFFMIKKVIGKKFLPLQNRAGIE